MKSVTISSNDSGSNESLKESHLGVSGRSSQMGGSLTHNDSTSSFSSVINTYEPQGTGLFYIKLFLYFLDFNKKYKLFHKALHFQVLTLKILEPDSLPYLQFFLYNNVHSIMFAMKYLVGKSTTL